MKNILIIIILIAVMLVENSSFANTFKYSLKDLQITYIIYGVDSESNLDGKSLTIIPAYYDNFTSKVYPWKDVKVSFSDGPKENPKLMDNNMKAYLIYDINIKSNQIMEEVTPKLWCKECKVGSYTIGFWDHTWNIFYEWKNIIYTDKDILKRLDLLESENCKVVEIKEPEEFWSFLKHYKIENMLSKNLGNHN